VGIASGFEAKQKERLVDLEAAGTASKRANSARERR
jgi:hypothetical protein